MYDYRKTPVSAVKLNVTNAKAMKPKDVYYLSATVSPSTASNTDLFMDINNTSSYSVASGRVTARGNGTAIITATAKDGSKKAPNVRFVKNAGKCCKEEIKCDK